MPNNVTLGRAIERAMQASPLRTQTGLADAIDLDQKTVSRIINGVTPVTVERLARIAHVCGVPMIQILADAGFVNADETTYAVAARDDQATRVVGPEQNRPSPAPEPEGS